MIRIRAHTLLCLQGFRGKGYSPEFVENLGGIHEVLFENPDSWVEVVDAPDAEKDRKVRHTLLACPHREHSGCAINGPLSEEEMRLQDRHVLTLLGLQAGTRVQWREILDRIRGSITGAGLPGICGQCRWLPLGYCREGIDRLRDNAGSKAEIQTVRMPAKLQEEIT